MRLGLAILLMALCVSGGFLDGIGGIVRDLLDRGRTLGGKLKNATTNGFSKVFVTHLLSIRAKLEALREKVNRTLQLTPERLAALKTKLSKLTRMARVKVHEEGDSIEEVNEKNEVGYLLYQSDIVLTSEQADEIVKEIKEQASDNPRKARQALKDYRYPRTLWNEGVSYYFDPSASEKVRSVFRKATYIWGNNTCIDFKESRAEGPRIRVIAKKGCWSNVGKLPKEQDICLGKGCETVGTATHELGHTLGFFHTHSRHDRDQYITVNIIELEVSSMSQFRKESKQRNENYGFPYDYGSNLHYGVYSGTATGRPVLVPHKIDFEETLGSRFLSFYDILMMNVHYGCFGECKNTKIECANGGAPNPRKCTRCLCPLGYGGPLCNKRQKSINTKCEGRSVTATKDYKTLTITLGRQGKGEEEEFEQCFFWIQSPPKTQLEIKVVRLDGTNPNNGCPYGGVELKLSRDPRMTGLRMCSQKFVGRSFLSKTNRTVVMGYSNKGLTNIELQFRFVTDGKPGPTPSTPKPVSTKRTFSTPRGWKCEDQKICASIKSVICDPNSLTYNDAERIRTCPKACGFC
ncbi:hypothetical protein Q1695_014296 [Nippostrongylus brasiliensis]|nr:hypothetical protein Q1695_014296 [Nippostrongylus brasiliensis]